MRRLLGALPLVVLAAGCGGDEQGVPLVPASGPPDVIRVAVTSLDDPSIVALRGRSPFRVAGARWVVAVRPGLRLVFTRMEPHAAAVAFRRGRVDVAPVAEGDIKAALRDPALRGSVRVRPLLALDVVRLDRSIPLSVRRFLWLAAPRDDYDALVPERAAGEAYGLLRGAPAAKRPPSTVLRRRARTLPRARVRLAGGDEAELVAALWREVGADVVVRQRGANARFERLVAPSRDPRTLFEAVLGPRARGTPLVDLDRRLRESAVVVPIAWVAAAKLVSRRLVGWRQDKLGATDYTRVHIRRS